jgi:signal transduction histidine kinase
MRHRPFKHYRPPWWPEEEPWPPQRRMRHYPFFRRIGCMFALFNIVAWGVFLSIGVSMARRLGWITFGGQPMAVDIPAVLGMIMAAVMTIAFVGWGLLRVFLPLDDLVEAADRVAQGDYSVRVRERGPRAVGSLARAFNNMASRLDSTQADRRNLLADVTHEMRTPLTVLQGNLEGMLDGLYPADEAHLRLVLDETAVLSRSIDDLRTLALAEAGALKLSIEPTDLAALMHDVTAAFQAHAEAQGVALSVDVAAGIPPVHMDPGRMRQVITNLLANALRYTPRDGSVQLACGVQGEQLIIEVRDSGSGIAAEDLPHVFDRFYRTSDSGGMGLGLAIARHLVEAHGGLLTAESAPGSETVMKISLPGT